VVSGCVHITGWTGNQQLSTVTSISQSTFLWHTCKMCIMIVRHKGSCCTSCCLRMRWKLKKINGTQQLTSPNWWVICQEAAAKVVHSCSQRSRSSLRSLMGTCILRSVGYFGASAQCYSGNNGHCIRMITWYASSHLQTRQQGSVFQPVLHIDVDDKHRGCSQDASLMASSPYGNTDPHLHIATDRCGYSCSVYCMSINK